MREDVGSREVDLQLVDSAEGIRSRRAMVTRHVRAEKRLHTDFPSAGTNPVLCHGVAGV
jgi:hypothetical protein